MFRKQEGIKKSLGFFQVMRNIKKKDRYRYIKTTVLRNIQVRTYSTIYSDIMNDTLLATFLSVDTPLLILAQLLSFISDVSASAFAKRSRDRSGGIYYCNYRSIIQRWIDYVYRRFFPFFSFISKCSPSFKNRVLYKIIWTFFQRIFYNMKFFIHKLI